MKKLLIYTILLFSLSIILTGTLILLYPKPSAEPEFTRAEILNIIHPKVEEYCNTLEAKANLSYCPTCYYQSLNMSYYKDATNFSSGNSPEYIIQKKGDSFLVYLKIPLIYGWNTRTGATLGNFTISEGELIDNSIEVRECL